MRRALNATVFRWPFTLLKPNIAVGLTGARHVAHQVNERAELLRLRLPQAVSMHSLGENGLCDSQGLLEGNLLFSSRQGEN